MYKWPVFHIDVKYVALSLLYSDEDLFLAVSFPMDMAKVNVVELGA